MKTARFFKKEEDNKIQCHLCPHNCKIDIDKRGICRVRKNTGNELVSENYGKVCSIRFDPIEKKPLYHYFPGKIILSVGSIGCNLRCKFCQNFEISQSTVDDYPFISEYTPREIVEIALKEANNFGISYTYNEPIVWYEFMYDIAKLAQTENLKNVMVTNGFINREPLEELCRFMDAFSVDLKAFTDRFYKQLTSSSLEPVLETLKYLKSQHKHIEITNLVIPEENDDEDIFLKMVKWIASEIGINTVLHLSRYYPTYKLDRPSTPLSTLLKFLDIAQQHLNYVFIGNMRTEKGQNTYCRKCGELVIGRHGYSTIRKGLDEQGDCVKCGNNIIPRGSI